MLGNTLQPNTLQPNVSFPTSGYDGELTRLVRERDDLLKSGIYKPEDVIVQQLNSRIEQLAMGRDAGKHMTPPTL